MNPDKLKHDLERLNDYCSALMVEGFSGKVWLRFDQGRLQCDVKKEQNDKLNLSPGR